MWQKKTQIKIIANHRIHQIVRQAPSFRWGGALALTAIKFLPLWVGAMLAPGAQ